MAMLHRGHPKWTMLLIKAPRQEGERERERERTTTSIQHAIIITHKRQLDITLGLLTLHCGTENRSEYTTA